MTEEEVRRIASAHRDLLKEAMALAKDHHKAIGIKCHGGFCPDDEDAASIVINGDVATIHYLDGGYGETFAAEFNFDARALWDSGAVQEGYARVEREVAAAREMAERQRIERERAEFERLRRKFEPTADLRADIRTAMEIETRIAAEEARDV